MRDNPIQFAVVREDPELEAALWAEVSRGPALLVASGGCTALRLLADDPDGDLTLVDPNAAQLGLVERKLSALSLPTSARERAFNVEDTDPAGLCACGNFEGFFRELRSFLNEFVAPQEEIEGWFADPAALAEALPRLRGSRFFAAAFATFFADAPLHALFTSAATQHAVPGSYPGYFQAAFEALLAREDAFDNPWVHQLWLGRFLRRAPPGFWRCPQQVRAPRLVHGTLQDIPDFSRYALISLSNVLDWMSRDEVAALLSRIAATARPGSMVVWRQLNHPADLAGSLGDGFAFDPLAETAWLRKERSGFYERVRIGVRR